MKIIDVYETFLPEPGAIWSKFSILVHFYFEARVTHLSSVSEKFSENLHSLRK